MALIAKRIGWEDNPEARRREYVIRLVANSPLDIPGITAADVWNSVPLTLRTLADIDALVAYLEEIKKRATGPDLAVEMEETADELKRDLRYIGEMADYALALVRNKRK